MFTWTAAMLLMIDRRVEGGGQRGLALGTGCYTPWPPLVAQLLLSPPLGSSVGEPHLSIKDVSDYCILLEAENRGYKTKCDRLKRSLPVSLPLADQSCLPISPSQRHLGNVSFQTLWKILTVCQTHSVSLNRGWQDYWRAARLITITAWC